MALTWAKTSEPSCPNMSNSIGMGSLRARDGFCCKPNKVGNLCVCLGMNDSTLGLFFVVDSENEYQRILRDLLRVAAAAVEPFLRKGECSVSHPEHRRAVLEELFRFVESQFDNPNLDLGPQDLRTLRLMAKALDLEAQQIGGRSRSSSNNAQSSLENLPLASILHLADRVLLGDEEFLKLQEQGGKASTLTELPLPPSKSNPRLAIALSHRTLYSPEPPILQRNWSPVEQSLQVLMRSIQSTQGTNIAAWSQQSVEHQLRRSAVFGDLWERGYFVTCGSKFGADFLVYQGQRILVPRMWGFSECIELSISDMFTLALCP